MTFYIQTDGKAGFVWEIVGTTAQRVGVTGAGNSVSVSPGGDILAALVSKFPKYNFEKLILAPGEYFPRMARPNSSHPADGPGYNPDNVKNTNLIAVSRAQLGALREQLERICRVVQPDVITFDTYGHEIRNLLILACTEVEAHWKGVLAANKAKAENTNDYVKLASALRLGEYAISFALFPWLPPIKPFDGWVASTAPTKDLTWYDAYNVVKHDRENHFTRATLRHAFEAVSACVVMMCAQFGWHFAFQSHDEIRSFFKLSAFPTWKAQETYTPSYDNGALTWPNQKYFAF